MVHVQVLNASRPSDFWLEVIAPNITAFVDSGAITPHFVALFTDVLPVDTFVDCNEFKKTVPLAAGGYPKMTDMLCALVLRGNDAHESKAEAMEPKGGEAMAPVTEAPRDGAAGGEDAGDGGIVTETDSALHMHGTGGSVAWSVGVSMAVALAGLGM